DLSESYDAFRRELGECRNAEVIDFDPVSDPDVVIQVVLDLRMIQGTKAEGRDTATVAVAAKVSGFDRHGVLVWGDDVVVYSPRLRTNGAYAARLLAAAAAANRQAARTLVHRLCGQLPRAVAVTMAAASLRG